MVKKSYGYRRRTRKKLKADTRPTVNQMLRKFEIGQKVHINIMSSSKSIPHPKFQGKTGTIIGKRGRAYVVEVNDMNAKKIIISRTEHLKLQR